MVQPTPIDQLRLPHLDQERIDFESARLLRLTAGPTVGPTSARRTPGAAPRPPEKTVTP